LATVYLVIIGVFGIVSNTAVIIAFFRRSSKVSFSKDVNQMEMFRPEDGLVVTRKCYIY
jgi:hypothetical protein